MREAVLIFRKDVRHLWPLVALNILLMGLMAVADAAVTGDPKVFTMLRVVQLPVTLSTIFLIVSLVHQEKLAGDRRYWFTRPIPWRGVLGAKLLFAVAFISAPLFVAQTAALFACGVSPLAHMHTLLRAQMLFFVSPVLEVAAVAAITTGMVQFVWVALLCLMVRIAGIFVVLNPSESLATDWRNFEWFRSDVLALLTLTIAIAILLPLYGGRRVFAARIVTAGGIVVLLLARLLTPWHAGFELARLWSGHAVSPSVAQLVYLPDQSSGPGLPIEVRGVPEGFQVLSERAALRIQSAGRVLTSSWSLYQQVLPPKSSWQQHIPLSNGPARLSADNPGWLSSWTGRDPIDFHATVAFTLLGSPRSVKIPPSLPYRWVPGLGFCRATIEPSGNTIQPDCLTLLDEMPAHAAIRTESDSAQPARGNVPGNVSIGFSPGFSIWCGFGVASSAVPVTPYEVFLDVRQPVAYFERELDIPDVNSGGPRSARP